MTGSDSANQVPIPPEMLLSAYLQGVFPMAPSRESRGVAWYQPDPRAILPLDDFHCPKTLRQIVRQNRFDIRRDTAFEQVVRSCADANRREGETWINEDIIRSYTRLHEMGDARSAEAWRGDQLVGGLYGVCIGGAYFGESMFHRPEQGGSHASKVCLVHLVEHMKKRGMTLLDVQINNPHMARFGVVEISHEAYMELLEEAINLDVEW